MKKEILYIIMLLLIAFDINAQTLTVFDLDISKFPKMKAKIQLMDAEGNLIPFLNSANLKITENGTERLITSLSCPAIEPTTPFSSVLILDASGSMGGLNISLAKIGAVSYIKGLANSQSENAVTSFEERSSVLSDFTNNKTDLINIINGFNYNKYGFTDYNAAFLTSPGGALIVMKKATFNKKVIIFLSDGKPTSPPETMRIIQDAILMGVKIYSVAIRMSIQSDMQKMAEQTGGKWFDNISTVAEAQNVYKEILEEVQGTEMLCTVEWESKRSCEAGTVELNFEELTTGASTKIDFKTPDSSLISLKINPSSVKFGEVLPGTKSDTTIILKAINSDIDITDIISSNPLFSVTPKNLIIPEGETREIKITFQPKDSSYSYGQFKIINNGCPGIIYASGGFPRIIPAQPTLKLTHPNGGEVFVIGSDTVVTWTGVTPDDTIAVDYSFDNGKNWSKLTNQAYGLNYLWKNIPAPPSKKCLIRIAQQIPSGYNDLLIQSGGKGGNSSGIRTYTDKDSNIYVCGNYTGISYFKTPNDSVAVQSSGGNDIFLVKYNSKGEALWLNGNLGNYGNDKINDMEVDKSGNVYLVGQTFDDVYIVKVNDGGGLSWTQRIGNSYGDYATGITADPSGNLAVTGVFRQTFEGFKTNGKEDVFIAYFNTWGGLIWAAAGGGPGSDISHDIVSDNLNNFYVTGEFEGKAVFNKTEIKSQGQQDIFILCYDKKSKLQFAKSAGSSGQDIGYSICSDNKQNLFLAGSFNGEAQFGRIVITSRNTDYFLANLNNQGDFLWVKTGGSATDDAAVSVACDNNNNIAVTGYITGEAQIGNQPYYTLSQKDIFVAKYKSDGNFIWARTATTDRNIQSNGVYLNDFGEIYVTGEFSGTANIGVKQITSRGNSDAFTWKVKFDEIQSDISDKNFSVVLPVAEAVDVDMKQVLIGSVRDSVVEAFITNTGSYKFRVDSLYFEGTDKDCFEVVSGLPPYIVLPGDSVAAEFRFRPSKVGMHNAVIKIITQANTIIRQIIGEGVQPQLLVVNKAIDFGAIQIGTFKDTLQAVTIRNIGNADLNISETRHGKPNDTDFVTIAGAAPFVLKPNEEAKMDLRFSANFIGVTDGTLEFHYAGTGSPAIIQLIGEGIDLNPSISWQYSSPENLICLNESEGEIVLKNEGINELHISEIDIEGNDKSSFVLNASTPIYLKHDSSVRLSILFKPQSTGTKTAGIKIKSNDKDNPEIIIPISAIKDSVSIIPETDHINLGFICPDEIIPLSMNIINKGTTGTGAYLTKSNVIETDLSEFYIDAGDNVRLDFVYKGKSIAGPFEEIITVTDSVCGISKNIRITGEVAVPEFKTENLTIQTFPNQPKDGYITLYNTGLVDFEILNPPTVDSHFEFSAFQFPISVKAGNSVKIKILFTSDIEEKVETFPIFNITPCSQNLNLTVTGITGSIGALVEVPDISANTGEVIEIPVYLKNVVNLTESGISSIDFTLEYNHTLLLPLDYTGKITNGSNAEILVEDSDNLNGNILTVLKFKTALGNSESCPLVIKNVKTNGTQAVIETKNGSFTLLDICYEGGARLMNSTGKTEIGNIVSVNTGNNLILPVSLIETGSTKISLYNSNGMLCREKEFTADSGLSNIEFDINGLAGGLYLIKLQTPTVTEIRKVLILK